VIHSLVSFLRFDKSVPAQKIAVDCRSEPIILGNKVKLQQVLLNLIKNASHAIAGKADGKIVVTLDGNKRDAILKVSDNGSGMTREVQERIWDPFFTTKGKEGTGLGLDICRKLIAAHGGTVTFESTPGAGTTFEIRLPVATAESAALSS
jgi:signal transduction histidine kinase